MSAGLDYIASGKFYVGACIRSIRIRGRARVCCEKIASNSQKLSVDVFEQC